MPQYLQPIHNQLIDHRVQMQLQWAFSMNRHALNVGDAIYPVALPQPAMPAVGAPAAPFLPANFPATKGLLMALDSNGVNALLQAYGLAVTGTVQQRINRLARHIGMSRQF